MELVGSSWVLPSEAFSVLKEEDRNTQMKAKTGILGARDMFTLAKILFEIFEPVLKISHKNPDFWFLPKLERSGNTGYFFSGWQLAGTED